MSEAPERIWATEDAAHFGEDRFHTTRPMSGLTEYIRADLHAAVVAERDQLKGLVTASEQVARERRAAEEERDALAVRVKELEGAQDRAVALAALEGGQ